MSNRGSAVRQRLTGGWSMQPVVPGSITGPSMLPDSGWTDAARAGPAAAVLRDAGRWSLDAPALRFDAQDWWYRVRFDAPDGSSKLVFDGLATLATIWLNGEPLGASSNMFVRSEFAVEGRLRPAGNELVIRFASLDAALEAKRPRPRWRTPMVEHQQLRWHRTTLVGRTPGWTPPCAPVGPWRDVWLQTEAPLLHEPRIDARVDEASGAGLLAVSARVDSSRVAAVRFELHRSGVLVASGHAAVFESQPGETTSLSTKLEVPAVARWWPHTHGEPVLYELSAVVQRAGAVTQDVIALGSIGFRSITWNREDGNFDLKVNGLPVFCRGACWTPIDPVTLRATPDQFETAIRQVREAGMNMLRVGGAFAYEDDAFFEACDRNGVLVWQDFMFANMDYPDADPAFLASVDTELRQVMARLQGRASLAILCGSSESEQQAAMWGAPRETWSARLFHEVIPTLVAERLPATAYWPSSAHGGAFPHQVDSGTTSYYGVGAYFRPLADARHSGLRFTTECLAFANVPDTSTIDRMPGGGRSLRVNHAGWKARAPRDLGAGWDFEDVRDHYLNVVHGVDPVRLRSEDHERYLALSGSASGEVMATTFAEWRRPGSACGGALVWFLRDLWAGAGWGLLDDLGRSKPCWYLLRRSLQPQTVLLTDEGNSGLFAHVVNERSRHLNGSIEVAVWRGTDAIARGSLALNLAPHSARTVAVASLLDSFMDLTHAFRFGPVGHDATSVALKDEGGALLAQTFHYPQPFIARNPNLALKAIATLQADGGLRVVIESAGLARGVHFDAPGLRAQDAWFDLAPGESRVVVLSPEAGEVAAAPGSSRRMITALNASSPSMVRLAAPVDVAPPPAEVVP